MVTNSKMFPQKEEKLFEAMCSVVPEILVYEKA
jgi:hypothetical protein